jgi:hypothetical protein
MLPRQAEQSLVAGEGVAHDPPHAELGKPLEEGAEQLRAQHLPLSRERMMSANSALAPSASTSAPCLGTEPYGFF